MPNYVFTYHGEMTAMPTDPAEVETIMAEWGTWYASMGDSVVDMGAPLGQSSSVTPDGSTAAAPVSITGYTIVTADDMAAAQTMAQGCPVLKNGHTVQIDEAIDLTQGS